MSNKNSELTERMLRVFESRTDRDPRDVMREFASAATGIPNITVRANVLEHAARFIEAEADRRARTPQLIASVNQHAGPNPVRTWRDRLRD